jgi:transcriptional regulator with XRE-family HTH domain
VTKDELNIAIGKRIVELRTEKGWSQSDLARAWNKDRQAIEVLENGKVNPTRYTLYKIATALELTLDKLTVIN